MPALLTSTSSPPSRAAAASTAARTPASSVTSARTYPTAGRPSGAVPSRSSTTTLAPAAVNAVTIAKPMPEAPPVTRTLTPSRSPTSGRPERLALAAEAVDLQLDHVAGAEVRGTRSAEHHAGRCSGVDHIPRVERHELGQVPDEVVHAEDHVLGVPVLPELAVHPQPQPEVLRIAHRIGRRDPGTERVERRAVLALVPLAPAFELELAFADVIADGVAGDHLGGIGAQVEIAGRPSDHHRQLDLVVGLDRAARDQHVVGGADDRVRGLHEQDR